MENVRLTKDQRENKTKIMVAAIAAAASILVGVLALLNSPKPRPAVSAVQETKRQIRAVHPVHVGLGTNYDEGYKMSTYLHPVYANCNHEKTCVKDLMVSVNGVKQPANVTLSQPVQYTFGDKVYEFKVLFSSFGTDSGAHGGGPVLRDVDILVVEVDPPTIASLR